MGSIYSNLTGADNKSVSILRKGDYAAEIDAAGVTDYFGLFGLRTVTVLAFINISVSTEADWLKKLNDLYSDISSTAIKKTDVVFIGTLYRPSPPITDDQDYLDYLTNNTLNGIPFVFARNDTYAGSAAERYANELDGSVSTPYTYIIYKRGASLYRTTDKFHRNSSYNGEASYFDPPSASKAADLIRFDDLVAGWTKPYTLDSLKSYVYQRLVDHLGTAAAPLSADPPQPRLVVTPDFNENTAILGSATKVHDAAAIRFAFARKAVGAYDCTNYAFSDAGVPIAGGAIAPFASAAIPVQTYLAAPGEVHDGSFQNIDSHNAHAIAFDPAALADTAGNPFAVDPAKNPLPHNFMVDTVADSPVVKITISDGGAPGTSYVLSDDIDPPALNWTSFYLKVEVKTAFPSPIQPTGRVLGPIAFATKELVFTKESVATIKIEGAGATALPHGVYSIVVDRYQSNSGGTSGSIERSLVVHGTPYSKNSNKVEGWGYFPREEGLPTASLAPTAGSWTQSSSGVTPHADVGNPLTVDSASASAYCNFARLYSTAFDSGAAPAIPGSARSFAEACLWANASTPGAATDVFDQIGAPWSLRDTGVGMDIQNGAFKASLRLVEVAARGSPTFYKTVGVVLPGSTAPTWALGPHSAASSIDWTVNTMLKLQWMLGAGTAISCRVLWKAASSAGIYSDSGILVPLGALVSRRETSPTIAQVAFGLFSGSAYGSVDTTWEFSRYGLVDESFKTFMDRDDVVGVFRAQRPGDLADYRRSIDILLRDAATPGAGTADPLVTGSSTANVARVILSAEPVGVTGTIPCKLRLFALDWDEANESDITGFKPTGFIPYGSNTPTQKFTCIGVSAENLNSGGAVAYPAAGFSWNFPLSASDLKRRYVLFAAVDSPLLNAPSLFTWATIADLLLPDPPAGKRTDCRYAARQFLPSFYVRDNMTEKGEEPSPGGWLSPDVALAIYDWGAGLPDPKGTGESTYPWGFAVGQPVPYDYSPTIALPIDSQDSTKQIKIIDSGWADQSATQKYYNRLWVRISNKGVVPGPARVQVYMLGSSLRTHFQPYNDAESRNKTWEKVLSNNNEALPQFVQDTFQRYQAGTKSLPAIVRAIPAMSGASDFAATKNYAIAEFVWHIAFGGLPPTPEDAHSCRAACVNLPDDATHIFTSGVDTIVAYSAPGDDSVEKASEMSNKISYRNSNIVLGAPAPTDVVTTKILIKNDSPVNFLAMPNSFRMTFGRAEDKWGLRLDATKFTQGLVILRVDKEIAARARPEGLVEICQDNASTSRYKFFSIVGGAQGGLEGLELPSEGHADPCARLYYHVYPKAKDAMHEVVLLQTRNSAPDGAYRITIAVTRKKYAQYATDAKTKFIYNLAANPGAIGAIPYERLAIYSDAGAAVRDGFKFCPEDEADFIAGKIKNGIANYGKGHEFPARPTQMEVREDGLIGAIVGRVVDERGRGIEGAIVEVSELGLVLGSSKTDDFGRYLIEVKTCAKTVRINAGKARREFTISATPPRPKDNAIEKPARFKEFRTRACFVAKTVVMRLRMPLRPIERVVAK